MSQANTLSQNPQFQRTTLYQAFKESPFGFVDAGSAGGIHPIILPVASLTHCTCFEPDQSAYEVLFQDFRKNRVFGKISLFNTALGDRNGNSKLYLTKSAVNSSVLKPRKMLTERYEVKGFMMDREVEVRTETLDNIVFQHTDFGGNLGEFIKLDCQGLEYEILKGGLKTLDEQCVALWCETELLKMYEGQRTFSELDLFLNQKGFRLYGFYPNYISAKKIDRTSYDTEERIIWADALYFKDPLSESNKVNNFTERQRCSLLLAAILTKYYDFALELIDSFYHSRSEKEVLVDIVLELASAGKKRYEQDLMQFIEDCQEFPEKQYLLAKKFVDSHVSNNNIDNISIF